MSGRRGRWVAVPRSISVGAATRGTNAAGVLIFSTRSCRVPRIARCIEARANLGNQRSRWKVARGPSIHFGWRRNTRDERGRGFDLPHLFMPSRSEEHTSEIQSLMRISYAGFCLKKKHTIIYNKQYIH